MKFLSNDRLVCSYSDGSISISQVKDKIILQNVIKGQEINYK